MTDISNYKTSMNDLLKVLSSLLEPLTPSDESDIDAVLIYWKVGFHIKQHIDTSFDKESYSAYLFSTLPQALQISRQLLYKCVQFYTVFPDFDHLSNTLNWGHYQALLSVKSPDERKALEKMAAENALHVTDLLTIIRKKDNTLFSLEQFKLPDLERFPYVGKIRQTGGKYYLDLGFYTYAELKDESVHQFEEDSLVQVLSHDNEYSFRPYNGDAVLLYTYKATLDRVIDGDTLSLVIDLGFYCNTLQRLRLRGIDAPVLSTPCGLEAKKYIDHVLHHPQIQLAITTKKRDRYSRFISDIYYSTTEKDPIKIINKGHYLNRELFEKGLVDLYLGG